MAEKLFSKADREAIVNAIRSAEVSTSGEIQVHIESRCKGDVLDRAVKVFDTLKMHQTKDRNGVLFYLAVVDHRFAILGDKGINEVVPEDFWEKIKEHMTDLFKQGQFTQGLIDGIHKAGEQLGQHFPYQGDSDINELPDEISFGS
ncbi:TLP18.3, Psb32 and MOLO-1 founding protein of phosphatase [Algoriphagus locisalis]|uniref:TLP18.3, Psb32 and MOLO-1 founding protein of phosphatase n=1 Tax=Algoriphagus locisalis TaxID=305507 RepID=A0A1I7APL6_9BACT|nr:TPM domain-containing protein [Algoriphagus locisalis]SFT76891.1 TLP18.3, Psb32 and MOLO-1 founding protein of phosphatase [Algoriphagus locisalis]